MSTGGGIQPKWRRDERELFYLGADRKLMAVPIKAGATIEAGTPSALFETTLFGGLAVGSSHQYDVTADGQRFLLNVPAEEAASPAITLVLNWTAGLKK